MPVGWSIIFFLKESASRTFHIQFLVSNMADFLCSGTAVLESNYMRAKTVKFGEPFFVCRRGLHALLRWRPYLVDISSDFKSVFFLHWYIVCFCGK